MNSTTKVYYRQWPSSTKLNLAAWYCPKTNKIVLKSLDAKLNKQLIYLGIL